MSRHNRERRRKLGGPFRPEVAAAHSLQLLQAGILQPGRLYELPWYHDSWCDFLQGRGKCNCDVEVGPPRPVPLPPAS